ncbi:MAG: type III-A CRISPR-associated RAMP protein Csm4 [Anaerolineae bacterium]
MEGPEEFQLEIREPGERWLTLSPYHPRRDEVGPDGVVGDQAAYTLLIRRGWVTSPEGMSLQRPAVRMLGEGSVLHHPKDGTRASYGDLADVTPAALSKHRVWRYGIAFPVPVGAALDRKEQSPEGVRWKT